ncbi:hypothetical protein ACFL09_00885 [Planctomycetota bacterium]
MSSPDTESVRGKPWRTLAKGALLTVAAALVVALGVRWYRDSWNNLANWPCIAICESTDYRAKCAILENLIAYDVRCAMWDARPEHPLFHGVHVPPGKARKAERLLRASSVVRDEHVLFIGRAELGQDPTRFYAPDDRQLVGGGGL